LVRSIDAHWEEIALDAARRIREESDVPHMAKLSDHELRDWVHTILNFLSFWPSAGLNEIMAKQFQELGRRRFETSIPLQEAVRCLQILKHTLFDFTRSRGFAQNAVEVYAQEELEHGVGLLFDRLVYAVVLGYQEAQTQPAHHKA
jgi:hypothetical protein